MTSHILIHNYYAMSSLVALTIGSFYVCNQIHSRLMSSFKLNLIDTNALIKFLMVLFGFSMIAWSSLLNTTYQMQLFGMLLGIIAGFFFAQFEARLLRYLSTKKIFNRSSNKTNQTMSLRTQSIKYRHDITSYHAIVLVAAFEEILYRGFMTILCNNLLNAYASMFCLLILTMLFAFSHLNLGGAHVLSKFILGFICLLSFLYTKTIVTPILIHTTFNVIALNEFRKFAYE